MSDFLPTGLLQQLHDAQRKSAARKNRLRVEVGGESYRVMRLRKTGFSIEAEGAPHLRGLVDLFDGGRHLSQCLIVASHEEDGQMHYEFKRNTAASDGAPLDYARDATAPIALLS